MKILQVEQYNDYDMRRYNQRVNEWQKDKFSNNIIPQIAFVGFRLSNGEMRKTGYVAFDDNQAYFSKTKKQAIEKYQLNNPKLEDKKYY